MSVLKEIFRRAKFELNIVMKVTADARKSNFNGLYHIWVGCKDMAKYTGTLQFQEPCGGSRAPHTKKEVKTT